MSIALLKRVHMIERKNIPLNGICAKNMAEIVSEKMVVRKICRAKLHVRSEI